MSYTLRFDAGELDGATPFPLDQEITTTTKEDGAILLAPKSGAAAFAKVGIVDPRQLFRLATNFAQRAAPTEPRDYFLVSFAALDTGGVPGAITYAAQSSALGNVSAGTKVGPVPLPLGDVPALALFSGYFLNLLGVPGNSATVEITILAIGDAQVAEIACCLKESAGPAA